MTDDDLLDRLIAREGGYVDHPFDKGGPTNFGITQTTLSRWRGRHCTPDEVKTLSEREAREIYRQWYLAPFADAPADVREHLIDIGVNSGVVTAKQLWTKAQAQTRRPPRVQLVVERLRHYAALVKARPERSAFIAGWVERAVNFL